MKSQTLRTLFIDFFKSKKHQHVPSSPLLPANDPTLLFNNAGMNQFKDYFLGLEKPEVPRAVTSQKCIRAGGKHNDLENVGFTYRHLTFFEMLGNFSFGDYFKKDAIDFAWEFITQHLQMEKDKLWVTIYPTDDEAYELWLRHVSPDRILRLEENFWMMGPTGPCGPCSEIYYDRGPAFGTGTNPAEDTQGDRVIEFWNLVFMQYEQHADGSRTLLPKPSIDTGMGLERILMLKAGSESLFETDVLGALMQKTASLCNIDMQSMDPLQKASLRVIADHIRTLSFAIADGIIPGPADRGYVLRKILRRAVRYGKKIGLDKPFLASLVQTLIDEMGSDYPELKVSQKQICEILTAEEEQFLRTLARGGKLMQQVIDRSVGTISGDDAFSLYDTYGFPQDEIELFAKDQGLSVDLDQFHKRVEQARELSKKARGTVSQQLQSSLFEEHLKHHPATEFIGEKNLEHEGTIVAIVSGGAFVQKAEAGEEVSLILDRSVFYPEKGGQVGDSGIIDHQGALFEVKNSLSPYTGVLLLEGKLVHGTLLVGEPVNQKVDRTRRRKICANHTATHLLHKALETRLGAHVRQAGSLVEPDRLRFDFTHHQKLSPEDLIWIEKTVNDKIAAALDVTCFETSLEEVQKKAEIKQFFGEKYGSIVRVVHVDGYSKELCGGTHVSNTSEIRLFTIVSESSIAAGIRRIEAVTSDAACDLLMQMQQTLYKAAQKLETTPVKLLEKIDSLMAVNATLSSQLESFAASRAADPCKGFKLIAEKLDCDPSSLQLIANQLIKSEKGLVLFLMAVSDKIHCLCRVDSSLPATVSADALLKTGLAALGGKGGGRRDVAQGAAPLGGNPSTAIGAVTQACNS